MCFLRNIETGGRCTGFTNGSKYKVNGEEIIVAKEYGIAYSTSILTRVLTSMGKTKRIRYHISKNENNILY